jgi:fumarate reductase subunit D
MLTFWNVFGDGPMLQAMYSIYVLLVLLVVSIIVTNKGAREALGWVGVAVIGTLILIVLFFKCYLL